MTTGRTFRVPRQIVPVAPGQKEHDSFPFDEVADRLDMESQSDQDTSADLAHRMAQALAWVVEVGDKGMSREMRLQTHGLRAVALIWVVNPNHFEGRSLRSLAAELQCSYRHLSNITAHVSRLLGRRNVPQRQHGATWQEDALRKPNANN